MAKNYQNDIYKALLFHQKFKKLTQNYSIAAQTSFAVGFYTGATITRLEIHKLVKRTLSRPLPVVIEPDDDGYIARTPDLPVYGFGDDRIEAIDVLKAEIESLYEDLMEDNEFTDDWIPIKKMLIEIIN